MRTELIGAKGSTSPRRHRLGLARGGAIVGLAVAWIMSAYASGLVDGIEVSDEVAMPPVEEPVVEESVVVVRPHGIDGLVLRAVVVGSRRSVANIGGRLLLVGAEFVMDDARLTVTDVGPDSTTLRIEPVDAGGDAQDAVEMTLRLEA
jgi:hypothetical protein